MLGIFLLCNSNFVFMTSKMSWPWNRGQRSPKVIESDIIRKTVYGFLLMFFSNIVPKTQRFWYVRLQNCHDLVNRVRGPSRSLEMSPCDRTHIISYWRSIVTMVYLVSFLRYSMSKNVVTLKSGSNVTQGHWQWYHSIDCVWFPVSIL